MIGHPQGACGAAGVAATVLGMRDGFLPPTINLEAPGPRVRPRLRGQRRAPRRLRRARPLQLHRLRLEEQRPRGGPRGLIASMTLLVPPRRPARERLDDPDLPVEEMRRSLEDMRPGQPALGRLARPREAPARSRARVAARRARRASSTSAPAPATWRRACAGRSRARACTPPSSRSTCSGATWRPGRSIADGGPPAPVGRGRVRASPSPTAPSTSPSRRSSSTTSRRSRTAGSSRELSRVVPPRLRGRSICGATASRSSSSRSSGGSSSRRAISIEDGVASVRQAYTPAEARRSVARSVRRPGPRPPGLPLSPPASRADSMTRLPYDAIVVGAGPAGSARPRRCSRRRAGRPPPREGPASRAARSAASSCPAPRSQSLDRLGLSARVAQRGRAHRTRSHPSRRRRRGRSIPPASAAAPGSRDASLDDLLARACARSSGAEIRVRRAGPVERGRPTRRVPRPVPHRRRRTRRLDARAAIGAWGRWDALDRARCAGFCPARTGFSAWSRDFARGRGPRRSRSASTSFPAATAASPASRADAFTWRASSPSGCDARLSGGWPRRPRARPACQPGPRPRALGPLVPAGDGFLGTGPRLLHREAARREQASSWSATRPGVIDPFSGEGQASALASGILAARRRRAGSLRPDLDDGGSQAAYATGLARPIPRPVRTGARRSGASCSSRPQAVGPRASPGRA